MGHIYLIIDESGAKGYSKNRESYAGEFGIMAGFFIQGEYFKSVESDLELMLDEYKINGKLHITDLDPDAQSALRQEVFSYLKSANACIVYDAQYVDGLHANAQMVNELKDEAKKQKRSNIKISDSEFELLLHVSLFEGVFNYALEVCYKLYWNTFDLDIISDNIDKPIIKKFEASVEDILKMGQTKKIRDVSGYDPDKEEVLKGRIETEVIGSGGMFPDFSKSNVKISTSDSVFTVVADIIANSLHYHFKSLQKGTPGISLNNRIALKGYELESLIYCIHDGVTEESMSDILFRHPGSED